MDTLEFDKLMTWPGDNTSASPPGAVDTRDNNDAEQEASVVSVVSMPVTMLILQRDWEKYTQPLCSL
jgi:hypothetical protein